MSKLPANKYLAFFLLLNIFNFVDRNLLMAFANEIKSDFNLSNVEWGLLTGVYFLFFYSIFGIFMGVLGDKFNRMKIIAVGVFLWSLMTAFTGIAKSFIHLIIARALIGIGESALTPNAVSMLSDLFPQNKRATASAIYYLGIPLGVGVGLIIASVFGPIFGWRTVFITLGLIGIVLAIITYFLAVPKRGEQENIQNENEKSLSTKEIISKTLETFSNSKSIIFLIIGGIFMHIPLGTGNFELLWAVNERGFTSSSYNLLFGTFFIVGGTFGAVVGGVITDKFGPKFEGGAMTVLTISYLILTPLTISYRFIEPSGLFFYLTFIFTNKIMFLKKTIIFSLITIFTLILIKNVNNLPTEFSSQSIKNFEFKIPTKLMQISACLKSFLIFCSSNIFASTILIKPALPRVFKTIPF